MTQHCKAVRRIRRNKETDAMRSNTRRSVIAGAAAAGATLAFPAIVRAQRKIQLKLSHYLPPTHGLHAEFMEPWARELEARTQGDVSVQVSPGTSSLGQAQSQLDQCRNGIVDVAFGLCGLPRGRMTRSTIVEMPFLVQTAQGGSRALWNLRDKLLAEDYRGLQPLALMTHNGGLFHTRDRRVEKPDDLQGLRIRTPSPTVSKMLEFLGASPVGMPPGQAYENLQRGALDGAAFPWDPVRAFKLSEVTKFHCDARAYTAAFWFAMNERTYRRLPADVRGVVDAISGEALIGKFQGWWDKWDAAGRQTAVDRGSTIVTLNAAQRSEWENRLVQVFNKTMIDFEKEGVKDARDIYVAMQREVARYEKKA